MVYPQGIGYSSLCYTLGPCCLPILNVIVYIYQIQTPSPSLSLPRTTLATASLFSMPVESLCFVDRFTCTAFQIPHISDIIWYLSFSF